MDTSSYEDQFASFAGTFKKSALPILIVSALLTVGLGLHLVTSPPEFRTDLNDFAPSSDSNDAHERIHEHFPDESRHSLFMLREITTAMCLTLTH